MSLSRNSIEGAMPSPAVLLPLAVVLGAVLVGPTQPSRLHAAAPIEELIDLSGKAAVIVTLTGRDNFLNEFRYDVSVKNLSAEPLDGDALVIVLEKITNLAGEEREPLTQELILKRMEVVGHDGETGDRKPYFRIPVDEGPDLAPYSQSRPVTVRLRNPDYFIVFTPSFRVLGRLRPSPATQSVQTLVDQLIQKGVLTEEEGRAAKQPPRLPQP
jgi:hypothetical protein